MKEIFNSVSSALVRVRNKIRRPDARIAIAMPPRLGTNTTKKLKCVYLFYTTYNWKSLTFCARTCAKLSVVCNHLRDTSLKAK